jgi:hypothetical protein
MEKRETDVEAAQEKIEGFVDDIDQLLHSARTKAEDWFAQREQISKHLAEIRDTASHLLQQLGHSAAAAAAPARRRRGPGRPKQVKTPPVINEVREAVEAPAPRKRTMSAAARAAISAAQKARWAKLKAAPKKK